MPVLSTRIVLDCFYLLIFYSEKFSTDVCRLPYAVNVNLNLSTVFVSTSTMRVDTLSGLALLHAYSYTSIDTDKVVREFCTGTPRSLAFEF